jgi:hypothetical protein
VLRAGCGLGQVALGTWRVEDERSGLGVFLLGDGGEGAEELVGDIGEDGGAAGGDFVLREEEEQAREEVANGAGKPKTAALQTKAAAPGKTPKNRYVNRVFRMLA